MNRQELTRIWKSPYSSREERAMAMRKLHHVERPKRLNP